MHAFLPKAVLLPVTRWQADRRASGRAGGRAGGRAASERVGNILGQSGFLYQHHALQAALLLALDPSLSPYSPLDIPSLDELKPDFCRWTQLKRHLLTTNLIKPTTSRARRTGQGTRAHCHLSFELGLNASRQQRNQHEERLLDLLQPHAVCRLVRRPRHRPPGHPYVVPDHPTARGGPLHGRLCQIVGHADVHANLVAHHHSLGGPRSLSRDSRNKWLLHDPLGMAPR